MTRLLALIPGDATGWAVNADRREMDPERSGIWYPGKIERRGGRWNFLWIQLRTMRPRCVALPTATSRYDVVVELYCEAHITPLLRLDVTPPDETDPMTLRSAALALGVAALEQRRRR